MLVSIIISASNEYSVLYTATFSIVANPKQDVANQAVSLSGIFVRGMPNAA